MIAPDSSKTHSDPDSFDVRTSVKHIVDAVKTYKWTVMLTTFAALLIVTLYIIYFPPVYTASTMLMVERDTDPVRDSFYLGWNVFRKDDSRTEIELMTSGPVLKEVVSQYDLKYPDVHHSFTAHATYLWGESWVGQQYRALKKQIFPAPEEGMPSDEEIEFGKTVVGLKSGVSLIPVAESNVGRLEVKGPTRDVAKIANSIAEAYLVRRKDRHEEEARRSVDILANEVERMQTELQDIEARRVAFLNKHKLSFDFNKEGMEVNKLVDLEDDIRSKEEQIASAKAQLEIINKQLEEQPKNRSATRSFELNSVHEQLKMRKMAIQTALIEARMRFQPNAPEVKDLETQLTEVEKLMADTDRMVESTTTETLNIMRDQLEQRRDELVASLAGAEAGLAASRQAADALSQRLLSVPNLRNDLTALDREYALAQEMYREILAKHAQAEVSFITANAAMPSMRIVEYAVTPAQKSWPKPKILYPSALAIGLFLGTCIALLRSYTSSRVRREHLEAGAGHRPIYGSIRVSTRTQPTLTLQKRAGAGKQTAPLN